VLQSAEAMKAAVNHLEQFMEKADTAARGKGRWWHKAPPCASLHAIPLTWRYNMGE